MADFNRKAKSPEYWVRRAEWIEQQVFKEVDQVNKRLIDGYNIVLKDIESTIAEFIATNQDLVSMSKPVTIKEYLQMMDWQFQQLDYWVKNGGTPETINRAKTVIDRLNTSHRLTRLEVLERQLQGRLGEFGLQMNDEMSDALKEVYYSAYDKKQFTIARGVGYGYQYSKPNFKAIEKVILYPWAEDGSMFSERIWEYTDNEATNFIKAVRRTIASGAVAQGKNPRTLAKDIVGFGKPSLSASQLKFNATRLLYTEATHILSEAEADVSKEWGLTDYVFLATLDERTSPICQSLDGQQFKYKDRKVGTNFPPMHPLCRSTFYDVVPDALYTKRASRGKDGQTVHEIPAHATYKQWQEFQRTGNKPWEATPTGINKYIQTILDQHKFLKDEHKNELKAIVEKMDEKQRLLYNKMAKHFQNSDYYLEGTGWYKGSCHKIEMDMDANEWEKRVGNGRTGAFNTKIHEEFHQLDHILADMMSPFSEYLDEEAVHYIRPYNRISFTNPNTKVGKRMSEAIEQDILKFTNDAIDWKNKERIADGEKPLKHIKDFNRIPSDVKIAFKDYLKANYNTPKDRAEIAVFTDAVGLHTEGRIHPYDFGYWGHDATYSKQRGKAGATSETWATYGSLKLGDTPEAWNKMVELMPNTVKVYDEVFEDLLKYVETNDLEY